MVLVGRHAASTSKADSRRIRLEFRAVQLLRLLILAGMAAAFAAQAQLRSIPEAAKPGVLRHLQDMIVELDGKPGRLSPGAQIRDAHNRLVLPASITQKTVVRYLPDASGTVHQVWILSAEELTQLTQAKPPPKKDEKAPAEK